jgi:hypothetical protein
MKKSRITKRVAIIAGTAVLALGGGTYAVAHGIGGGEQEREAFLNDAAQRLNVTPEELTKALEEAAAARIDQAQKDGRITEEQANEMKERLEQSDGLPFLGGPGGPGGHFRGGPPPGIEAAAEYLGLSRAELREQLMDGKSLADAAEAEDKSVDGLKDAMEKAIREDIEKAVDDERITRAQADRILENLDERIAEKVERTGGPGRGPHGRGPGGPGFGPPPGPPPGDAPGGDNEDG